MTPAREAPLAMAPNYQDDLAYIHDAGFGQLATSAAGVVVDTLRRGHLTAGTIVDLGCGGGVLARLVCDAGFAVVGVDLSEALIAIARARVPEAEFRLGSFTDVVLPPCVAVTAIGEVFNYAFDPANTVDARASVFGRVFDALVPGGLFLFDMAGPERAPATGVHRVFSEGEGWAVLMHAAADESRRRLTRQITTFRRDERLDSALYRRSHETHHLHLVDALDVMTSLERVGFTVDRLPAYGTLTMPEGLTGFLARRPRR